MSIPNEFVAGKINGTCAICEEFKLTEKEALRFPICKDCRAALKKIVSHEAKLQAEDSKASNKDA